MSRRLPTIPFTTYADVPKNPVPAPAPPPSVPEPSAGPILGIRNFLSSRSMAHVGWILGIGGVSLVTYYGIKYLLSSSGIPEGEAVPDEVKGTGNFPKVKLHQCPRGFTVPCTSPLPLKIETFLRMAGIPYEVDFSVSADSSGKVPWMTVGNSVVTHIHECIPALKKSFGINLDQPARPSRSQASRLAEVMLENRIYWSIAVWRWVFDQGSSIGAIQPFTNEAAAVAQISESVKRASKHSKVGQQSYEEVVTEMATDLAALSAALGKHDFFMGDSPGEIDSTAFAMLAQIFWAMPNCPFTREMEKYPNLCQFVMRMRISFWPDWSDILVKPEAGDLRFFYPLNEFGSGDDTDSDWEQMETDISRRSTPTRARSTQSSSSTKSRSKGSMANWENNNVQSRHREVDNLEQLKSVKAILNSLKLDDSDDSVAEVAMPQPSRSSLSTRARSTAPAPSTKENFLNLSAIRDQMNALEHALKAKIDSKPTLAPGQSLSPNRGLPFSQGQPAEGQGLSRQPSAQLGRSSTQMSPLSTVGYVPAYYTPPPAYFPTRSRPVYYPAELHGGPVPVLGQVSMSRPDLRQMPGYYELPVMSSPQGYFPPRPN